MSLEDIFKQIGASLKTNLESRSITVGESGFKTTLLKIFDLIDTKQDILVGSGTGQNIKTVSGVNILGTGDIPVSGGSTYTADETTIHLDASTSNQFSVIEDGHIQHHDTVLVDNTISTVLEFMIDPTEVAKGEEVTYMAGLGIQDETLSMIVALPYEDVKIYKKPSTLLYEATLNEEGYLEGTMPVTEDSTYYIVFEGVSGKYPACQSADVEVKLSKFIITFTGTEFQTYAGCSDPFAYTGNLVYSVDGGTAQAYSGGQIVVTGLAEGTHTIEFSADKITGIGDQIFYDQNNIVAAKLISTLEDIGEATFNGTGISDISFWKFNSIPSGTFATCSNITDISNISEEVNYIGEAVFNGTGITSLDGLQNIQSIGSQAFAGCANLTDISGYSYITSKIEDGTFSNCFSLASVDLSDHSNIKEIGNEVFADCENLKIITLPPELGVMSGNVFLNDPLEQVHFTGTTVPEFTNISFADIPSTCIMYVPNSVLSNYQDKFTELGYTFTVIGE